MDQLASKISDDNEMYNLALLAGYQMEPQTFRYFKFNIRQIFMKNKTPNYV